MYPTVLVASHDLFANNSHCNSLSVRATCCGLINLTLRIIALSFFIVGHRMLNHNIIVEEMIQMTVTLRFCFTLESMVTVCTAGAAPKVNNHRPTAPTTHLDNIYPHTPDKRVAQ